MLQAWLNEFARKPNTQRAYAREARRLLLWWDTVHPGRNLAAFDRDCVDQYVGLLKAPPAEWVAARVTEDKSWRPFRGPLSAGSLRQALVILQAAWDYLGQRGFVDRNPFRTLRDKGPSPQRKHRSIPSGEAMSTAEQLLADRAMEAGDAHQRDLQRRDWIIWVWIYWTGARRHEIGTATFQSISVTTSAGVARWWWEVRGKGGNVARLPLDRAVVQALAAYHQVDIADLPSYVRNSASHPLIPSLRGDQRPVGPSQVYDSIRRCSAAIREIGVDAGLAEPDLEALALVRPHTLRAIRATRFFGAGLEARFVQRHMRHAKMDTTLIYDHTADDAFHDAVVAAGI